VVPAKLRLVSMLAFLQHECFNAKGKVRVVPKALVVCLRLVTVCAHLFTEENTHTHTHTHAHTHTQTHSHSNSLTLARSLTRSPHHAHLTSHPQGILFFSTRDAVKFFEVLLKSAGGDDGPQPLGDLPVFFLHGGALQQERTKAYLSFCKAPTGLLCCTDVAARGLDMPKVRAVCVCSCVMAARLMRQYK
jgi:superfamily II DNA/RNA helicase